MQHNQSPRTVRIVSGFLAAVWLCASVAALVLALLASRWLLAVVGLAGLWYGIAWVRVARRGRLLTIREALVPWRTRQPSDG